MRRRYGYYLCDECKRIGVFPIEGNPPKCICQKDTHLDHEANQAEILRFGLKWEKRG